MNNGALVIRIGFVNRDRRSPSFIRTVVCVCVCVCVRACVCVDGPRLCFALNCSVPEQSALVLSSTISPVASFSRWARRRQTPPYPAVQTKTTATTR